MTAATASAVPTRIQVERRFPLALHASIDSIRDLYETAKRSRWDPIQDVPWERLDAGRHAADVRDAARAVWSRRAWIEYTGMAETPALLIRFCLELDREADAKYFLTVRNTEEAWHVEAFHRAAEAFGGYLSRPADARWEPVFNQALYRHALGADHSLDEYVAVHCALEDSLELDLYRAYAASATDTVIAGMLGRVVGDKTRHAAFGWRYLEVRAASLDADAKAAIGRAAAAWIGTVACAGYHVPSLSTTLDTTAEVLAARRVADAGLGAVSAGEEERVAVASFAQSRERLSALGIPCAPVAHPRLGAL